MQLELTLPCCYAYAKLTDGWNDHFARFQVFKKYGAETEISDFEEFINFFQCVSTSNNNELCDEDYVYFDIVPKEPREKLILDLIQAALELKYGSHDCWERSHFKYEREKYEELLHKQAVARHRFYAQQYLQVYLDTEYPEDWRYRPDRLDYEINRYIKGGQTLEEALHKSDQENNYRKVLLGKQ